MKYKNILIFNKVIGKTNRKRSLKKKNKKPYSPSRKRDGPSDYIIYCIINFGYFMNKGSAAASVARAFMGLYNKVNMDRINSDCLEDWEDDGEKLKVLEGINHKHLIYLSEEISYAAVETYILYQMWGKSRIALVLAALGRQEDLEELLDGLSYFK